MDATISGGNVLRICVLIEILSVSFHLSNRSYNPEKNGFGQKRSIFYGFLWP